MKRHVLAALLPLLLAGCQTASEVDCKPAIPNSNLQANANASQAGMTTLLKSGAINQKAFQLGNGITANSQRISIEWDGDAVELLNTLARQRGYRFVYTGTRLPLPVNVHVNNMTFEQVLDLIRVQTGWRAKLVQEGVELRLYFTLPDKGGRLA